MAKKKTKTKVKAEATAKAEIVARATYQRKRTTTEVIPPDVTRARADSWLTIISPLTEWAGLRGDILKSKRDQLRLQREDVLFEIAKKAKVRIDFEGGAKTTIPNKFTVPFLEKASLEDPASPLCEAWSNLFVEAARNFDPKLQVYADILSRIGWKEAKFLRDVCFRSSFQRGIPWPHGHFPENAEVIEDNIRMLDISPDAESDSKTNSEKWGLFKEKIEASVQFCYLIHGTVLLGNRDGAVYFYNRDLIAQAENPSLSFDMLERERLVRRSIISFAGAGSVSYVDLTYLAVDLIRVCTRNFSVPLESGEVLND
jgi:hypothetical protein